MARASSFYSFIHIVEDETGENDIELTAEYQIQGAYSPASWTDPADYPEVEIIEILDKEGNSYTLSPKDREKLETEILENENDFDPPDDPNWGYDDNV
jgi:hypothetical protein